MAPTTDSLSTIAHVDGIPDHELIGDLLVCLIVSSLEGPKRAIRENNAPAIGNIGRVALNNGNIVRGVSLFDEQTTIQTCRPCAQDDYFQRSLLRLHVSVRWNCSDHMRVRVLCPAPLAPFL